ncbi:MAG: heat-inducible transcription repressor HrcA [Elusimicrobia bacterium]|nr:heat-inducible transcription repressor HrcA [Elusimicrobiota bacterium]
MRILEEKEKKLRHNRLLQTVIFEFIQSANPVPSSVVSERDRMDLSSATVRNLLHELEEEGLVTHPHKSSGCIPTDKGYRFYVDYLLHAQELVEEERRRIEEEYRRRLGEVDALLTRTSHMLAYLSRYAGFVLRPKLETGALQRIELLSCNEQSILLILVAKNGLVRYRMCRMDRNYGEEELRQISQWINRKFQGQNLRELCSNFEGLVTEELDREFERMREALKIFAEPVMALAEESREDELLMEGAASVLTSLAAPQGASLRDVAETLENREEIISLLSREIQKADQESKQGTSVVIGEEAQLPQLKELSIVSRSFQTPEETIGVLGIIGPKRMEYGRMVSLVEAIHRALSDAMGGFH